MPCRWQDVSLPLPQSEVTATGPGRSCQSEIEISFWIRHTEFRWSQEKLTLPPELCSEVHVRSTGTLGTALRTTSSNPLMTRLLRTVTGWGRNPRLRSRLLEWSKLQVLAIQPKTQRWSGDRSLSESSVAMGDTATRRRRMAEAKTWGRTSCTWWDPSRGWPRR
jgi:hypothetical protein